jgi:hypothetical protein
MLRFERKDKLADLPLDLVDLGFENEVQQESV